MLKKIFAVLLIVSLPLSLAAHFLEWEPVWVFLAAAFAIVPLASYLGAATEEIALVVGPNLGGLLNATFGNATELILAYLALRSGLVEVVKATITGSIISNLLLVMGFAMLFGGLRHSEQDFTPKVARLNASSMNLAIAAILLPTALQFTSDGVTQQTLQSLSVAVAVVLILVYLLTLLFSMKTHSYLYDVKLVDVESNEEEVEAWPTEKKPNLWFWVGVLLVVTLVVAYESELLVGSLESATDSLGLTALFTGAILLPIIGNAAEHATAVTVAVKNKMDLSMSVAVGSSMQIALFVAPVLVIAGAFIGQPMDLNFNPFELVAVFVAVFVANSISSDGNSNWFEGVLLLATYSVVALSFYFHPLIEGFG